MAGSLLFLALCGVSTASAAAPAKKTVLNTAWWPPGTELKAESIGILSRDVVYYTGMMEDGDSVAAQVWSELNDTTDIGASAGLARDDLGASLVDCLMNVPAGAEADARASLAKHAGTADLAISVFAAPGEYTWANSSITCTSALAAPAAAAAAAAAATTAVAAAAPGVRAMRAPARRAARKEVQHVHGGSSGAAFTATTVGVPSRGLLWLTAQGDLGGGGSSGGGGGGGAPPPLLPPFFADVQAALAAAAAAAAAGGAAGGRGAADLVDCLVVLADGADAATARAALTLMSSGGAGGAGAGGGGSRGAGTDEAAAAAVPAAALTLVLAPGMASKRGVLLRCTAAPGAAKVAVGGGGAPGTPLYAVAAAGLVFTEGAVAKNASGAEAFLQVDTALRAVGSKMNLAVNCLFFLAELGGMSSYFAGFYAAFNVGAPPPPSRTEFVAAPAECPTCALTAKCIGLIPDAP